ncbi:hypothetical protein [Cyanophage S-TIM5]|uniref:Uncharacterized protein n=1 Tax=Cyanophage S-TIM5 TaxID=1137745 RepID=H6WG03_9CAUD|nr:hypothetical protein F417_gp083 [Cyanophage S-TIM5]AEZ65728.1 hypothetical protein [Cyanophage S-TIM5]UYE96897.1 hypothetical protein [Cyanophage S-TIM66]UYE97109.1 hypothetical protein [Cyanophage S-TIM61]
MLELLLNLNMTCQQADALILKINKYFDLSADVRLELVDTVKDYTPECEFYWDAND